MISRQQLRQAVADGLVHVSEYRDVVREVRQIAAAGLYVHVGAEPFQHWDGEGLDVRTSGGLSLEEVCNYLDSGGVWNYVPAADWLAGVES